MRAVLFLALVMAACAEPTPSTPPVDAAALPTSLPARLSETGLYADLGRKQVAADLRPFTPAHALWSDAAQKQRWIALPAGATIDATDLDHWRLPVGTRLFKEFAREGRRLETRVIWRVGDGGGRERDTLVGAYVWNDDESEAYLAPDGAVDVRGTDHDVPSQAQCWKCHLGEPGHALGFSALQLGDLDGWPLAPAPAPGTRYAAPSDVLGYLHANCGHCHNPNGGAWADSSMVLRLGVDERDPAATQIVATTVGVPLQQWIGRGYAYRVVAGDPDASAILFRMTQRTLNVQMPPLGTEHQDDAGVALVRSWIEGL